MQYLNIEKLNQTEDQSQIIFQFFRILLIVLKLQCHVVTINPVPPKLPGNLTKPPIFTKITEKSNFIIPSPPALLI